MCFYGDFIPEKPKLPEKKYYIDTNHIHLAKENMEIINPVKDGMSEYEQYFKKLSIECKLFVILKNNNVHLRVH